MIISLRIAGVGGQGIIFAGIVIARAASLYENAGNKELYAVQTQTYGPEARGGVSKCDVKISDHQDFCPFIEKPDFLILMSQSAYDEFIEDTKPETIVIIDSDAVASRPDLRYFEIPAVKRAKEVGKIPVANIIMLGAFVNLTQLISIKSVVHALHDVSPKGTFEMNKNALMEGIELSKPLKSLFKKTYRKVHD